MTNVPTPLYIYKLVSQHSPIPDKLPERLPLSDIDEKSGFIHLSAAAQVPNTLKTFFADDDEVTVLRLRYANVEKEVKWEDPETSVCGPRNNEGAFPVRIY